MNGILGIILAVLNILATLDCLKGGKPTRQKVIWILVIWLLPVVGLVLYHFVGKK